MYFVVTTSAWGLWLSLYSTAVMYSLWQWKGAGDIGEFINTSIEVHQELVLVVVLAIGLAMKIAGNNSQNGMKALYGGSFVLYLMISIVWVGIMMLLVLVLTQ